MSVCLCPSLFFSSPIHVSCISLLVLSFSFHCLSPCPIQSPHVLPLPLQPHPTNNRPLIQLLNLNKHLAAVLVVSLPAVRPTLVLPLRLLRSLRNRQPLLLMFPLQLSNLRLPPLLLKTLNLLLSLMPIALAYFNFSRSPLLSLLPLFILTLQNCFYLIALPPPLHFPIFIGLIFVELLLTVLFYLTLLIP